MQSIKASRKTWNRLYDFVVGKYFLNTTHTKKTPNKRKEKIDD